jgi:hypothetical protein
MLTVDSIAWEVCNGPFPVFPFDSNFGVLFDSLALVFGEHSLEILNLVVIAFRFVFG